MCTDWSLRNNAKLRVATFAFLLSVLWVLVPYLVSFGVPTVQDTTLTAIRDPFETSELRYLNVSSTTIEHVASTTYLLTDVHIFVLLLIPVADDVWKRLVLGVTCFELYIELLIGMFVLPIKSDNAVYTFWYPSVSMQWYKYGSSVVDAAYTRQTFLCFTLFAFVFLRKSKDRRYLPFYLILMLLWCLSTFLSFISSVGYSWRVLFSFMLGLFFSYVTTSKAPLPSVTRPNLNEFEVFDNGEEIGHDPRFTISDENLDSIELNHYVRPPYPEHTYPHVSVRIPPVTRPSSPLPVHQPRIDDDEKKELIVAISRDDELP